MHTPNQKVSASNEVNEALKTLQAFSDSSGVQQFKAVGEDGRAVRVSFIEAPSKESN
jgi:hypothetical protein